MDTANQDDAVDIRHGAVGDDGPRQIMAGIDPNSWLDGPQVFSEMSVVAVDLPEPSNSLTALAALLTLAALRRRRNASRWRMVTRRSLAAV